MELLLALCRAYFLAEEILSAGGAFLSRKGLAWSKQGTTAESGTAAIGAGSQQVTGLSLPPIHPGSGCLVWTDCFSWSVVWDGQLSCLRTAAPGSAEARSARPGHRAGVRSCRSGTRGTAGRFGVGTAVKPRGSLMGTVVRRWSGTQGHLRAPRAGRKGSGGGGRGLAGDGGASPGNCSKGWVGLRSISAA